MLFSIQTSGSVLQLVLQKILTQIWNYEKAHDRKRLVHVLNARKASFYSVQLGTTGLVRWHISIWPFASSIFGSCM
jgi:hypothetical protein